MPRKDNSPYIMPLLWFEVFKQNPDYFTRVSIDSHNLRELDQDIIRILSRLFYSERKVILAKHFITPHGEYYFSLNAVFTQITHDLYMEYLMNDHEH